MEERLLIIINEIRNDKGEEHVAEIKPELSLRKDLGFDSMDLATFTARVDEEFGVDVFETGIVDLLSDVMEKLG
ncbi:acyl carrier protein [Anaerovibrio lipolyticus DSM 3074]|uniref:Carrier domain-containing protein n=2 Tax=Anaerovibrio lipolyticus TaxID=82374 RepID=A0A0B2JYG5_9FIRM|nr:acyl carrier protein [Anaerovibrio lipolyticus]KHM51676.1 hypothetical protein NZ47_09165 [Anaerovibrio lipolyticus]SHJ00476.1 acyl carrier protein [Anaerovibrio lipolyticus DSM 3074]